MVSNKFMVQVSKIAENIIKILIYSKQRSLEPRRKIFDECSEMLFVILQRSTINPFSIVFCASNVNIKNRA